MCARALNYILQSAHHHPLSDGGLCRGAQGGVRQMRALNYILQPAHHHPLSDGGLCRGAQGGVRQMRALKSSCSLMGGLCGGYKRMSDRCVRALNTILQSALHHPLSDGGLSRGCKRMS
jgi:hypothetical protein